MLQRATPMDIQTTLKGEQGKLGGNGGGRNRRGIKYFSI